MRPSSVSASSVFLPSKQEPHVAHRFLILLRSAQSLDAWAKAAFDVILQTRARRLAIDFDIAGAKLKRSVDYIDRFPRHAGRQEWTKVKRAVLLNAPSDYSFRKRLVDREFEMRIRFVVF